MGNNVSLDYFISGSNQFLSDAPTSPNSVVQAPVTLASPQVSVGEQLPLPQTQSVEAFVYSNTMASQVQNITTGVPIVPVASSPSVFLSDTYAEPQPQTQSPKTDSPAPNIPLDEPLDTNTNQENGSAPSDESSSESGNGETTSPGGNAGNVVTPKTTNTLTTLKPYLIIAALLGGAIIIGKLLKSE